MAGEHVREEVEQPEPLECCRCNEPATLKEDGALYCFDHDPARKREREERRARESAIREANAERDVARSALIAAAYAWAAAEHGDDKQVELGRAIDAAIAAGVTP